jgi:hypothetical protein
MDLGNKADKVRHLLGAQNFFLGSSYPKGFERCRVYRLFMCNIMSFFLIFTFKRPECSQYRSALTVFPVL